MRCGLAIFWIVTSGCARSDLTLASASRRDVPETGDSPTPRCGDGLTGPSEECDDANTDPGDGCTPNCTVQAGWYCDQQTPSRCAPTGTVIIDAGTFTMGSPDSEPGHQPDEVTHTVLLTHSFSISAVELTQGEFQTLMGGWNPSNFDTCAGCPVEQATWYDAVAYANELTKFHGGVPCYLLTDVECNGTTSDPANSMSCMNTVGRGLYSATVALNGVTSVYDCTGFRLPTEAEWEYAARAGTATATYNGDLDSGHLTCETPNPVEDPIAWFCGNAGSATHVSATRQENPWGVYDILGNVWEWCHDWQGSYGASDVTDPEGPAAGSARVLRGGSWINNATSARAAFRAASAPGFRFRDLGVRVVRSLP